MAKNKKASKLTKAEQKYVIGRLLGFAKRFIPLFVIAFIFAAVSTVMSHYIPVLVGNGIDLIIGKPIENNELGFKDGGTAEYKAATEHAFDQICALGGYEK